MVRFVINTCRNGVKMARKHSRQENYEAHILARPLGLDSKWKKCRFSNILGKWYRAVLKGLWCIQRFQANWPGRLDIPERTVQGWWWSWVCRHPLGGWRSQMSGPGQERKTRCVTNSAIHYAIRTPTWNGSCRDITSGNRWIRKNFEKLARLRLIL